MISDKLYLEAEQSGITVLCGAELSLTKSVSVELPDGEMFIGIDDSVMRSRAEERVHQRCERIADAYAIKKLVDEDELKRIIDEREGDISVWELSEWFDVTEKFMMKAVKFYFGDK